MTVQVKWPMKAIGYGDPSFNEKWATSPIGYNYENRSLDLGPELRVGNSLNYEKLLIFPHCLLFQDCLCKTKTTESLFWGSMLRLASEQNWERWFSKSFEPHDINALLWLQGFWAWAPQNCSPLISTSLTSNCHSTNASATSIKRVLQKKKRA